VERQKRQIQTLELKHNDNENYILNLASLSSPALHRKYSEIQASTIGSLGWVNAIHDGLGKWGKLVVEKKDKKKKRIGLPSRS
jgi:hypothetical protein